VDSTAGEAGAPPSAHPALRRFLRHRLAVLSLAVLAIVVVASMFAGSPRGPTTLGSQSPSLEHPMGTTDIGDDLLVLVLHGARRSVAVGVLVAALSTVAGVVLGAVAGYYRGWMDSVLARVVDLALTIPVLAVLLVVTDRVRDERDNWVVIALIISAVTWPGIARVVRAVMVSLSERDFAESARAIGASDGRIIVRHLLPQAAGPIVVIATLTVALGILAEAALSFLGFGVTGSGASLGSLVAQAPVAAATRPWLFYCPGAMLLLICLAVNFVGDGLRDSLDPNRMVAGRRALRMFQPKVA
jgi:peptide/nickel transport system permease protein